MKERPILFKPRLVRAILSGQKTQTRRLAKNGRRSIETGDHLWVRESHFFTEGPVAWYPDMPHRQGVYKDQPVTVQYRAAFHGTEPSRWRPSIHMPKWASRITLEVTEVRWQRLQEITPQDILAEGVGDPSLSDEALLLLWKNLWDSINGKKPGASWDDDPEVWAYTFKVINGDTP
ncbi:MAG: hypothetical protein ACE366_16855 [Bradymonadia bacterium]